MKKFLTNFAYTLAAIMVIQVVAELSEMDWLQFCMVLAVFCIVDLYTRLKKAETVLYIISNKLLDKYDKKPKKKKKRV